MFLERATFNVMRICYESCCKQQRESCSEIINKKKNIEIHIFISETVRPARLRSSGESGERNLQRATQTDEKAIKPVSLGSARFSLIPHETHRPHIDWHLKCKIHKCIVRARAGGTSTSSGETDGDVRPENAVFGRTERRRRDDGFSCGCGARSRRPVRPEDCAMEVEKPPAGALRSDHHRQVESFLRPTMRLEEGVERRIGVFGARPGIGVIPLKTWGPGRERHERERERETGRADTARRKTPASPPDRTRRSRARCTRGSISML